MAGMIFWDGSKNVIPQHQQLGLETAVYITEVFVDQKNKNKIDALTHISEPMKPSSAQYDKATLSYSGSTNSYQTLMETLSSAPSKSMMMPSGNWRVYENTIAVNLPHQWGKGRIRLGPSQDRSGRVQQWPFPSLLITALPILTRVWRETMMDSSSL
jgi:hypothetical protein